MIADEPITRLVLADRSAPHVLCLTLNRPAQRNAYNARTIAELEQWLDYSEGCQAIRTVILTGCGSTFCSGADLKEVFDDGGRKLRNRHGGYNPLQHQPRRKIWIAALNGHAIGGGLEMALACDFIVASEQAKIALPEVTHGLLPLGGAIGHLATRLPLNLARELLLTGDAIDASRALSLGLFNQIAAPDALKDVALALAARINRNAPLAVQACNALLQRHTAAETDGSEALRQLQQSDDYQESLRAFREGRPPQWSGR